MKDFKEDYEFGIKGEELFLKSESWKKIFGNVEIEKIIDLNDQKFKGDFKVRDKFFIELKTRKPNYAYFCGKDIIIELDNTKDGKKIFDAWLDKYSEDTYLFYQWTEIVNSNILLMNPVIVFKPIELKNHLKWINRFKKKESPNNNYNTIFVRIPIEKLEEKIRVWRIVV